MFVLRASIDGNNYKSEHQTAREAAQAAWDICEEEQLEMPSEEWEVDTRYGPQSCYNMMVPSGHNWECDQVFVRFVKKHAANGEVRLYDGDNYISVTNK